MTIDMHKLHTDPFYDAEVDKELVAFRLDKGAILPKRASDGAVGYDLYVPQSVRLIRDRLTMVDTGVAVESPVPMLLLARSSLSKSGIVLAHSVGLIDPDYRGNIKLPLVFRGFENPGPATIIEGGTAIAQLVFFSAFTPTPWATFALTPTVRGDGGFGSTGG